MMQLWIQGKLGPKQIFNLCTYNRVNHLGIGREYHGNTEISNGEFSVGYTRLKNCFPKFSHTVANVNKNRRTESHLSKLV